MLRIMDNPAVERDWPKAALFMDCGNLKCLGSRHALWSASPSFLREVLQGKGHMNIRNEYIYIFALVSILSGCVTVPETDRNYVGKCGVSSDHKVIRIANVAKETNSYYSIGGILLTPILIPVTALISGTYVLINNAYYSAEEIISCQKNT